MNASPIRVCLVDDDALLLAGMQRVLRRTSPMISLTIAANGADALALLQAQPIDVLISDLRMPGMDGRSLLAAVQLRFPHIARVVITGALDPQRAFDLQLVAHRVVAKPVETAALARLVHQLGPWNASTDEQGACGSVQEVQWSALAARCLRAQGATVISAEVACDNPWLAVLLLQAGNAGFVACGHPLDVQTAVRALGPEHLAIMLDRLQTLPTEERDVHGDHVELTCTPPPFGLAAQAREVAERVQPDYALHHADADTGTPALSRSDFLSVVESAALLWAASATALSPALSERDRVLRTAWGAARVGVPDAIVQALRESVNEPSCESASAGAAVRETVALMQASAVQRSTVS